MTSKDNLLQAWQELTRFWDDEASRAFELEHLSKIIECMTEIEREFEKFSRCSDDHQ